MSLEEVQKVIFDFFVNSLDYNGIPLTELSRRVNIDYEKIIEIVKELVIRDLALIQSSINPHIIFLYHEKDRQIEFLDAAKENEIRIITQIGNKTIVSETKLICVYPSPKYLTINRNIDAFQRSPYTRELALASPQLSAKYFDIDVLERYAKDPRFRFSLKDYSGEISYAVDSNQVSLVKPQDEIFLKTFGLGMDRDENKVVVVFLRYLKGLKESHQLYWQSYENNNGCLMFKDYNETSLKGGWPTTRSIYAAFIEEQRTLNELSKSIFEIPIFLKTFEEKKRPKDFTFLFIPTSINYNNFVLLFDKMISENINKDFFKRSGFETFETITLSNGQIERKMKNTLRLFEEWLSAEYTTIEPIGDLFTPFKKIRVERQTPAHRISENSFDKKFLSKQAEMIKDAYYSMKYLRMIFQKHPSAFNVEIPAWLDNGDISIH